MNVLPVFFTSVLYNLRYAPLIIQIACVFIFIAVTCTIIAYLSILAGRYKGHRHEKKLGKLHPLIDQLLLLGAAAGQLEVAEEQEKDQPQGRHEEDAQQPGHGRGGPPVAGDDAHGQDPDGEIRAAEQQDQPRRQCFRQRKWPQHSWNPRYSYPRSHSVWSGEASLSGAGRTKLEA